MRALTVGLASVILSIYTLASLWPSTSAASAYWRCTNGYYLYQRLADHTDGVLPNDLFFDRLVYVHHEGKYDSINNYKYPEVSDLSVTLNGAIISETLVLTSWNPFRNIIRFRFKRFFTSVCAIGKRGYHSFHRNFPVYILHEHEIVCARPVIPFRDKDIPIDLWHGYIDDPKMHSPMHDLVVFRVHKPFYGLLLKQKIHSTEHWRNAPGMAHVGPIMTYLANETDVLGRTLKFAMLGNNLSKVMTIRRNIYVREYQAEENVVTDCDEWIPREWGWFICLRNIDNIPRLASGAMLFHNELLYGVGAFSLWKGKHGVLVFTDVRKYYDLIYNTCTDLDQLVPHPKKKTTTPPTRPNEPGQPG